MSEILFRNFQLLVCCGLLHQLPVTEISDAFCHSILRLVRTPDKFATICLRHEVVQVIARRLHDAE
jgi:hypothetical protein